MREGRILAILDFWFGKKGTSSYLKPKSFWYGDETDDLLVFKTLGEDYEFAKSGQLANWSESFDGSLALIILLDQVPRNIFRNKPQAYATDEYALEIAKRVVEKGWDKKQPSIIRRYIYSPYNHSECLEDQEKSLTLFTSLGDPQHLYWAQKFYDTIKKYGRFPHRDSIYNR